MNGNKSQNWERNLLSRRLFSLRASRLFVHTCEIIQRRTSASSSWNVNGDILGISLYIEAVFINERHVLVTSSDWSHHLNRLKTSIKQVKYYYRTSTTEGGEDGNCQQSVGTNVGARCRHAVIHWTRWQLQSGSMSNSRDPATVISWFTWNELFHVFI